MVATVYQATDKWLFPYTRPQTNGCSYIAGHRQMIAPLYQATDKWLSYIAGHQQMVAPLYKTTDKWLFTYNKPQTNGCYLIPNHKQIHLMTHAYP